MLVGNPFPFEGFFLSPGNRIDVDLIISEHHAGDTLRVVDTFSRKTVPLGFIQVAESPAMETPQFPPPQAGHFPQWEHALDVPVFHEFMLDAERGGHYGITWTIDGRAWPEDNELLLQHNRFYRLRFTNLSGRLHPMHLHGQFFRLLARDGRPADERFWRDTVLISPEETIDIGLVATDKGAWANHCHILEHAAAGMMSLVRVQ